MDSDSKYCFSCGSDTEVITAPLLSDPETWVIYRKKGVEVTYIIVDDSTIDKSSKKLTTKEILYIKKYVINQININMEKTENPRKDITQRVLNFKTKNNLSYDALSKKLGITKMTLFKRKKLHNWKVTEIYFIEKVFV